MASFRVSVFAMLFDARGHVLLARRADNGQWNLPGGGMDLGESSRDCVVLREVEEETRLRIEPPSLVAVLQKLDAPDVVFLYRGERIAGEPGPTEESTACAWFELGSLPANLLPRHRSRLTRLAHEPGVVLATESHAGLQVVEMLRTGG